MVRKTLWNETGRTLIELLGVLALLVLLTLGGLQVWRVLHADVIVKDLTTAVMQEATIRQHALRAKSSNTKDIISRQGPYGVGLEVENGIDGVMSDYFWVKTGELDQEVCESMLKKIKDMQSAENKTITFGLVSIMNSEGQKITLCSKDKRRNALKYLFSKNPSYHLHGSYPWWTPKEPEKECSESAVPNGGSVSDGVLTCRAGYYKTGYGTCNETCKPCTGNTYRAEETTTGDSSCDTCEAPMVVGSIHTSCNCYQEGEQCTEGEQKGLYNNLCECEIGACNDNNDCDEGQKCGEDDQCESCDDGDICPTCPESKPYRNNGECVVCLTDVDCGLNEYCDANHTCQTACTDEKSSYNKETQKCECNNGHHGAPYDRDASSTCFKCGEGSYAKLPQWDEDQQKCVCVADTTCDGTEMCDNGECKPIETCNTFQATECQTACRVENHEVVYTYAPVTTYYNNSTSTHKHCGDPNDVAERGTWVCDDGYVKRADGSCKNGCDGFVANTCTTGCTSSGTDAIYTPAAAGTACEVNAVCDGGDAQGVGSCVCDKGYELKDGVCTAVAANWYKDVIGNAGAKKCTDWRANTVTNSTATTSTSDCVCNKGYELKSGASSCTAVAQGWYKDVVGNTGAQKCSDWRTNTTTTSTGSTSTSACVCNKGYELKNNACTAVAQGKYKDVIGNTGTKKCTDWRANTTTSGTGNTSTNACVCKAGYYLSGSSCTQCAQGYYKDSVGNGGCTQCPSYHTTNGTGKTSSNACSSCSSKYTKQGTKCCLNATKAWSNNDSSTVTVSGDSGCEYEFYLTKSGSEGVVCNVPSYIVGGVSNASGYATLGCGISVAQTHNKSTSYTKIWGSGCYTDSDIGSGHVFKSISISAGSTTFGLKSNSTSVSGNKGQTTSQRQCNSTKQNAKWHSGYGESNSGNTNNYRIRMRLK